MTASCELAGAQISYMKEELNGSADSMCREAIRSAGKERVRHEVGRIGRR